MAIKEEILAPAETVSDDKIVVLSLHADDGVWVEKGETIAEIEASKAVVEIESPIEGYIQWLCKGNQEMAIGDRLAFIHDQPPEIAADAQLLEDSSENNLQKENVSQALSKDAEDYALPVFTKKAFELLKAHGLSETLFLGRNFVRESDIANYINKIPSKSSLTVDHSKETAVDLPLNAQPSKLSVSKRFEIRSLSNSQNLVTSNISVKVRVPSTFFEDKSTSYFDNLKNDITPFLLIKQCGLLKRIKELNAFYHEDSVYYYEEAQLGYVLDLGKGLKVVNLGDVSEKTCAEVKRLLMTYLAKYTRDKLSVDDLNGATFTVTDVSAEGVLSFSPLINRFQSAILGISSIDEVEKYFILNLVFDHRVTEAKKAALCLKELKEATEQFIVESLNS